MATVKLPQGRGQRRGQDAYVGQREAERTRTLFNLVEVPPNGVLFCNLSASDASYFFPDGLGRLNYTGWGLCDGADGRPTVANYGTLRALIRLY